MESQTPRLHILFFPLMANGHTIPTLDMAKLFAGRGVKSTIITTPLNVPLFEKTIEISKSSGLDIDIKMFNFPTAQLGLPQGCESIDFVISNLKSGPPNLLPKFFLATKYLKDQLEDFIGKTRPDCLIADMFFPWATESADKFGVPRLVFHGTSTFALTAVECVDLYEPHKKVESDSEPFIIPNLPGNITMTRREMGDSGSSGGSGGDSDFGKLMKEVKESETKCFGVVVNSFYELEPAYADFFRNVLGRKTWHVGPVSLCNKGIQEKTQRGGREATINEHECLKWLDSKKPNSVVYISFGSMTHFTDAQLMEIAVGLEHSGTNFIWVVRKENKKEDKEEWLPEGFEERMQGKGLIIRGWAPQILILDHEATGGFVTHCGWNSVLEGVSAGLPMVTWPVSAEQFYNEKLVTQVLKTGVSVGVQRLVMLVGDFIEREKVERAVRGVMEGKEAEERRRRAIELAGLAKTAVGTGGSSWSDLTNLMRELVMISSKRDKKEET